MFSLLFTEGDFFVVWTTVKDNDTAVTVNMFLFSKRGENMFGHICADAESFQATGWAFPTAGAA